MFYLGFFRRLEKEISVDHGGWMANNDQILSGVIMGGDVESTISAHRTPAGQTGVSGVPQVKLADVNEILPHDDV